MAEIHRAMADAALFHLHHLVRILSPLLKIAGLHITDVQETVSTNAEIDEHGLDSWLKIDNFSFVDITNEIFLAFPFYIKFLEPIIFNNRNPIFFGLRRIDKHCLFHLNSFFAGD